MNSIQVPDFVEPITAWRIWLFGLGGDSYLHALSARRAWLPREAAHAVCFNIPPYVADDYTHSAPHPECMCGLWALKDERSARMHLRNLIRLPLMHVAVINFVIGEVAVWGRVIEHEVGYRAQFAYPRRMFLAPFFRTIIVEPGEGRARRLRAHEAATLLEDSYGVETTVGRKER